MKKIDEMSLKEILNEIKLSISGRDMYIILRRNNEVFEQWESVLRGKMDKKAELDKRISALSEDTMLRSEEDIRKALNISSSDDITFTSVDFEPFEEYIDKRALVLLTLYNWQIILEENNGKNRAKDMEARQNIKKAMKFIGQEDFDITSPVLDKKSNHIIRIRVINSQEVVDIVRKAKKLRELQKDDEGKRERILAIERDIGISCIVRMLIERDFEEGLTRSSAIGEDISAQISYNGIKMYQEAHPEIDVYAELAKEEIDKQSSNPNGNEEDTMIGKIFLSKEYRQSMKDAIVANYKYIDVDMMLLIAAYRYLEVLEYDYEKKRVEGYLRDAGIEINQENITSVIEKIIRKIEEKIGGNPEFAIKYDEENIVDFSEYELLKSLRRFSNGRYIKGTETEEAKASLMANEKTFLEIEDAVLRTMDFTDEEFQVLIGNSEENVIYLINHGLIEKGEIMGALYARETCSEILLFVAYQKGLLDDQDIIKLFEDKKIDGEIIAKIEDKELREKISDYAKVVLRESYLAITLKEDAKPEELEMFVRSIVLYKKMCIEGRTEEEIASNSFELVSSFEDNISSEILQELYQFGIISLDIAADWGVDLTEMLASNSIKPTDLKNLYAKKVISIDEIKNVLINGSLSYEEKLDLIYSTFDGESEEEALAREELIGLLGMGESYKSEERGTGKKRGIGNGTRNKEFITEPHTRWKLLSLLDKDYSKGCLPEGRKVIDGHRVFLLPNHNKVVIERMHEKRNGKRVSAYGNATYVMGIEEFYKSIDDIIIDGAINRTYLREAQENGQATKIIHSKHWGNSIKRQFGVNTQSSRYTQEEIKAIDEAIKNVENSRKERE